jgi:hypothetical protein
MRCSIILVCELASSGFHTEDHDDLPVSHCFACCTKVGKRDSNGIRCEGLLPTVQSREFFDYEAGLDR